MVIDWFAKTYIPDNTGLEFGKDLRVSQMPDEPDNCIALFNEPGIKEGYMNEYASDSVGMLVQGRGTYKFLKRYMGEAGEIPNNLDNLTEIDAGDFRMKMCSAQGTAEQVDIDSEGRRVWTLHFLILINNFDSKHRQQLTQP